MPDILLQDRHTTARAAPIRDQSQDWVLLHGEERNNSGTILTILKFIRRLDTCDSTDDIAIKVIIFSETHLTRP